MRRSHLRRSYGITLEQYEAQLEAQDRKCAICTAALVLSTKPGRRRNEASLDHDHKTGAVRGILCSGCNRGIGMMGDDPKRLRLAADYLDNAALRAQETHDV